MQETASFTSSSKYRLRRPDRWLTDFGIRAIALVVLFGLALGLRLYLLDAKSLRLDETYNYATATGVSSWDLLLGRVYRNGHPPFFYLALHQWIKYFGSNELVMRLPSVIAGMVQIIALFWVGRTMFSLKVGYLAAFFAAINPFLISYSQELGVYSFFAAATACMLLFFWQALRQPRTRYWILFSLAALAALYVHLFTLYLFLAEPFIVLPVAWFSKRFDNKTLSKNGLLTGWSISILIRAIGALAVIPTFTNVVHQPTENPLPFVNLPQIFYRLIRAYTYRLPLLPDTHSFFEVLPVAVAIVLLAIGATPALSFVATWFQNRLPLWSIEQQKTALATYVLVWLLIIPPLVVFGLSFIVHMFDEPYLISGTNYFWLLIAYALVTLWNLWGKNGLIMKGLAFSAGVVFLVAALIWLDYFYFDPQLNREPWAQATEYLTDHVANGDVLMLEPGYDYTAVSYYYLGYTPLPTLLMGAPYTNNEANRLLGKALLDQPPHYWLVTRSDDVAVGKAGPLRQQLDKTMRLDADWVNNVLEIREYSQP